MSSTKKRLTLRRKHDSSGHWADISSGDLVDVRLKPWRSISRLTFTIFVLALIPLFSVLGVILASQMDSEVNPRVLANDLSGSVYEVFCGDYSGTAFALDVDFGTGYETYLVSAAHVFEQCEVGDSIALEGQQGKFTAKLIGKSSTTGYSFGAGGSADVALLGARFASQKLTPSRDVNRGDWAVAMGYPWNQEQYVSFGVVGDQNATEVFVDTPLNEGNSGGPIVNGKGEVIGVVSYYPLESDLYEGNPDGIYDRADGIAAIKKLTNLCVLPANVVPVCPFE